MPILGWNDTVVPLSVAIFETRNNQPRPLGLLNVWTRIENFWRFLGFSSLERCLTSLKTAPGSG